MKLDIDGLKRGNLIVINGDPYIVMRVKHVHMGRGGASVQSKLKNLRTGKVVEKSLKPSESFEEANIEKLDAEFIYEKSGEYWFHEKGDRSKRFSLSEKAIGEQAKFLKGGIGVMAFIFEGDIINVELPIKADYKVVEAPPNVKGNTSQGGNKVVTLESGAKVTVPLFIETGDTIRVNTDIGEYTERAK